MEKRGNGASPERYGLMKLLQESKKKENENRRSRGVTELHIDGWAQEPQYDRANHRLIWALNVHTADAPKPSLTTALSLWDAKASSALPPCLFQITIWKKPNKARTNYSIPLALIKVTAAHSADSCDGLPSPTLVRFSQLPRRNPPASSRVFCHNFTTFSA